LLTAVVSPPAAGSALPGYAATVNFLDATPSAQVAGLSVSIGLTPGWTIQAVTPLAGFPAAKQLLGPVNGVLSIASVAGVDGSAAAVLGNGQLFSVACAPPNTSGLPAPLMVTLMNPVGVSASGAPVQIATAPTAYLCSVFAVAGNCTVTQADVELMERAQMGLIPCANALALVGDGQCSIGDVQQIVLAAEGQSQ
jgi:hypothetical protein